MFFSLGILLLIGWFGGWLFEKIRLPRLIFYLLLGIMFGPSLLAVWDESLLQISSYLRQMALVIILTRSGLSLDFSILKKIGRSAVLMCFVPAVFEIIGIAVFAPLLLGIKIEEALLLGSVLGAVSPAIVVPRMISLQKQGYGQQHHVCELIMAGASLDDVFVIVCFYAFKGLISTSSLDLMRFLDIPVSIGLGLLLGSLLALFMWFLFKKIKLSFSFKTILMLGMSFLMLGIEECLKPYVSVSSLLGILWFSMVLYHFRKEAAKKKKKAYDGLWDGFEILLFVLVGAIVSLDYAFSKEGAMLFGLILIGLVFRSIGVCVCVIRTLYTVKEKLFIILSYLPKATVQASIGGIALQEGLPCGEIILTGAVIAIIFTAPVGGILMDCFYPKLLIKDTDLF